MSTLSGINGTKSQAFPSFHCDSEGVVAISIEAQMGFGVIYHTFERVVLMGSSPVTRGVFLSMRYTWPKRALFPILFRRGLGVYGGLLNRFTTQYVIFLHE